MRFLNVFWENPNVKVPKRIYGKMEIDTIKKKENCMLLKSDGNPSHYKNVPVKKMHILKNDKYMSRPY